MPTATSLLLTDFILVNAQGITSKTALSTLQLTIQGAGFQLDAATPNNLRPVVKARADGLSGHLGYVDINMAIVPKGGGGVMAAVPDSTAIGGNVRGANAVDWQTARSVAAEVAAAADSTIGGGRRNQIFASATGGATISGGVQNTILNSGVSATIGGGTLNSINTVSQAATISGGQNNTIGAAGGNNCTISGGQSNACVGSFTTVGGGVSNTASGDGSTIPGGWGSTTRALQSMLSYSGGMFSSVPGSAQIDWQVQRGLSTSATPVPLTADGIATPGASNLYILANNSAALVTFDVVARNTGTGTAAAYRADVLVRRGANAAATALVAAATITTIAEDAAIAAADITVTVDTTNGGVRCNFVGIAANTFRAVTRASAIHVT